MQNALAIGYACFTLAVVAFDAFRTATSGRVHFDEPFTVPFMLIYLGLRAAAIVTIVTGVWLMLCYLLALAGVFGDGSSTRTATRRRPLVRDDEPAYQPAPSVHQFSAHPPNVPTAGPTTPTPANSEPQGRIRRSHGIK